MTKTHLSSPLPSTNARVVDTTALPTPRELWDRYPLSQHSSEGIAAARRQIARVIDGRDERLLVVVGPCSIHDPKAALDYAERLSALRKAVSDALLVVMRVYFEKPRTTIGWKGLISDPHLDGSSDIKTGLAVGRKLLMQIAELGLPVATEFLDPVVPSYVGDAVSWAAIGARTTESQTHREMASGLSMPVGFKNGTDGGVSVAINAMLSAQQPHSFVGACENGRLGVVRTSGNPYGHVVLRGGRSGPNYDATAVSRAQMALTKQGVCPRVMVDCSHGNSEKDYRRQADVLSSVSAQVAGGSRAPLGVMIESHLVEGKQAQKDPARLTYGQSITDACVNLRDTETMLLELARAQRQGRVANTAVRGGASLPRTLRAL